MGISILTSGPADNIHLSRRAKSREVRLSGPIAVKLAGTHMNAVCCQGRSQIWFCPDWLEGKPVDRRAIALVVSLRGCSVDCVRDRILRLDGQSARDMQIRSWCADYAASPALTA